MCYLLIYLSLYLEILALKPDPELTEEKFSLTSGNEPNQFLKKKIPCYHFQYLLHIEARKSLLPLTHCILNVSYGGFNIYITQIPLCLMHFRAQTGKSHKQHIYSALMLFVAQMYVLLLAETHVTWYHSPHTLKTAPIAKADVCQNLLQDSHFHIVFSLKN